MYIFLFIMMIPIHFFLVAQKPPLSQEQLSKIGQKIWHNESNCSYEKLVHWNKGEEFASLGIGHFIWYPSARKSLSTGSAQPYEEIFPKFILFLKKKGHDVGFIPAACPWENYETYVQHKESAFAHKLRQLLSSTIAEQTEFMFNRLENVVLAGTLTKKMRKKIATLKALPDGMYALIDYVNFKGTGLVVTERYNGQGWGLVHVLENINDTHFAQNPLRAFAQSARRLLELRVCNAPKERHEERWLRGWLRRLETYE